jgi:hypothetical protein
MIPLTISPIFTFSLIIYSECLIDSFYNSYLIYYSQVIQFIPLKLLLLVIHIFGCFYLIQAHLHSFPHLLS